jgi:predicted Zn-dependent protease
MIPTPLRRSAVICLLLLLSACSGLVARPTATAPDTQIVLSAGQASKVGAAVEARLLQGLGGPYADRALVEQLRRFEAAGKARISVADSSRVALYPLPGGRLVLTRGLLANLERRSQLRLLLAYAISKPSSLTLRGAQARAARQLLAATDGPASAASVAERYDPNGAAIRLARLYERQGCDELCVEGQLRGSAGTGEPLPEAVTRLRQLREAYRLLARATTAERQGAVKQALSLAAQTVALAPDEAQPQSVLGQLALRSGLEQQARAALAAAIKLQPDYYRTRMGFGYLDLKEGRIRRAQKNLAESVRLLPLTENLFLLAEAYEKGSDATTAAALYRRVADSDRNSKLGRLAAKRLQRMELPR